MSLLLSHWYPGSGVVLDCMDSLSLPSFLLFSSGFLYYVIEALTTFKSSVMIVVLHNERVIFFNQHIILLLILKRTVFINKVRQIAI